MHLTFLVQLLSLIFSFSFPSFLSNLIPSITVWILLHHLLIIGPLRFWLNLRIFRSSNTLNATTNSTHIILNLPSTPLTTTIILLIFFLFFLYFFPLYFSSICLSVSSFFLSFLFFPTSFSFSPPIFPFFPH